MTPRARVLFLTLMLAQAAHSVEEYVFALYDRLPVAHVASTLVSSDPRIGFAVLNVLVVGFGLWCWAMPVRHGWPSARTFAWIWVAIEVGNGVGHPLLALRVGGYFPGVATAPILLIVALTTAASLGGRSDPC